MALVLNVLLGKGMAWENDGEDQLIRENLDLMQRKLAQRISNCSSSYFSISWSLRRLFLFLCSSFYIDLLVVLLLTDCGLVATPTFACWR